MNWTVDYAGKLLRGTSKKGWARLRKHSNRMCMVKGANNHLFVASNFQSYTDARDIALPDLV